VWGPSLLAVFISPTHNRTEGRAQVWGFEYATKDAHYKGGSAEITAGLKRTFVLLTARWWRSLNLWNSLAYQEHLSVRFEFQNLGKRGRAGAMRAIAPNMPPHACPRQGHRRPAPRFYAAGTSGTNMRQWWSVRRKAELAEGTSQR